LKFDTFIVSGKRGCQYESNQVVHAIIGTEVDVKSGSTTQVSIFQSDSQKVSLHQIE
jgi:hypothetical protein